MICIYKDCSNLRVIISRRRRGFNCQSFNANILSKSSIRIHHSRRSEFHPPYISVPKVTVHRPIANEKLRIRI